MAASKIIVHQEHPAIEGISEAALAKFMRGQREAEVDAGPYRIRPSEIAGVANEPSMDNAKLTAVVAQLQFELKQAIYRITCLEKEMHDDE